MRFKDITDISGMKEMMDAMPKFSDVGLRAARFGLDAILDVCERIGSPHTKFPSIHVAGTNGKGTTCRLLASTLMEAGYRTGLTTSPHLLTMHERIRVDDQLITDEELLRFIHLHADVLDDIPLTYFELTICMAFWHFAQREVDIAIVETGLGGRLDATNIVTPLCSVITSIGYDHTDVLGETLSDIAGEKAGIIKPGVPVVVGELPQEALGVIRRIASERGSALIGAMGTDFVRDGDRYRFSYLGSSCSADASRHPIINTVNSAIVRSTLESLHRLGGWSVPCRALSGGIERFFDHFPVQGHAQRLFPDRDWYFDGAHNPQALAILRRELSRRAPLEEWTIVFSIMKDKLNPDVLRQLDGFGTFLVMPMESPRAATFDEIRIMYERLAAGSPHPETFPTLRRLDDLSRIEMSDDASPADRKRSGLVIFTGSFYFYSTLMAWKHLHPPLP